jgi:hypothetical protein
MERRVKARGLKDFLFDSSWCKTGGPAGRMLQSAVGQRHPRISNDDEAYLFGAWLLVEVSVGGGKMGGSFR